MTRPLEQVFPVPAAIEDRARAGAAALCDAPALMRTTSLERVCALALLGKRRPWSWAEVGWVLRTLRIKATGADRRAEW